MAIDPIAFIILAGIAFSAFAAVVICGMAGVLHAYDAHLYMEDDGK